jgi:sulfur-carrier protein
LNTTGVFVFEFVIRFFACKEDLSHHSPDSALPEAVASGGEPFLVIGAIAGG